MKLKLFFENKELVDSFVGADKNRLSEIIKNLVKKYPNEESEENNTQEDRLTEKQQKKQIEEFKKILVYNYIQMIEEAPDKFIVEAYKNLVEMNKRHNPVEEVEENDENLKKPLRQNKKIDNEKYLNNVGMDNTQTYDNLEEFFVNQHKKNLINI